MLRTTHYFVFVLVAMFVFGGLRPDIAHACSCAYYNAETDTTYSYEDIPDTQEAFAMWMFTELTDENALIFSGQVDNIIFHPDPEDPENIYSFNASYEVTLVTDGVYRGEDASEITVMTEDSAVGCGYPFAEGENYVVVAHSWTPPEESEAIWSTYACSANIRNPSNETLARLGTAVETQQSSVPTSVVATDSAATQVGLSGIVLGAAVLGLIIPIVYNKVRSTNRIE